MATITVPLGNITQAIRDFFSRNPDAEMCLSNKEKAGSLNVSVTKRLYKFLKTGGFSPRLLMGKGFRKPLVKPCVTLAMRMRAEGPDYVRENLSHGVVKVNDMVIDLTHLRLGENYQPYSFPYKLLSQYWDRIVDVTNAVEMSIDTVRRNLRESQFSYSASDTKDVTTYTWFKFKGVRKLTVLDSKGKTLELRPDQRFGVRENTAKLDHVIVQTDDTFKVYTVDIPKSDKLMSKSVKFRGKISPTAKPAIKPKKVVKKIELVPDAVQKKAVIKAIPKISMHVDPEDADDYSDNRVYKDDVPNQEDFDDSDFDPHEFAGTKHYSE
jgi:hypothetical protein